MPKRRPARNSGFAEVFAGGQVRPVGKLHRGNLPAALQFDGAKP